MSTGRGGLLYKVEKKSEESKHLLVYKELHSSTVFPSLTLSYPQSPGGVQL